MDQLEDDLQRDFIRRCLRRNPTERPTARELLFHPVLFEVHSLKLLAAHSLVNSPGKEALGNFFLNHKLLTPTYFIFCAFVL